MKDNQKNHTRDEGGKDKKKNKEPKKNTAEKKKKKNRRETIEDSLSIYIYIPGRIKVLKLACSTSTVRLDDTMMMMMMMALTNHTKTNTK
jgi:hypothetical protein